MGVERIINELKKVDIKEKNNLDIIIVVLNDDLRINAEQLSDSLRNNHIKTIIAPRRSMKAQFRFANNMNAKFAIILGEDEIKNNVISIKSLNSKKDQIEIKNDDIEKIISLINSED